MNDYGIKNNKGYRIFIVVIDNFSKFSCTIPLKTKYTQSITDAISQIVKSSKRQPSFLETDDGKEYVNKIFNDFPYNNNIKRYSRITALGAVFAERFNRTIRNLLKTLVFEKRNADWLSEQPSVNKKNQSTVELKWLPFQLVKNQMKKKSIQNSKTIEKFKNQNLISDN